MVDVVVVELSVVVGFGKFAALAAAVVVAEFSEFVVLADEIVDGVVIVAFLIHKGKLVLVSVVVESEPAAVLERVVVVGEVTVPVVVLVVLVLADIEVSFLAPEEFEFVPEHVVALVVGYVAAHVVEFFVALAVVYVVALGYAVVLYVAD